MSQHTFKNILRFLAVTLLALVSACGTDAPEQRWEVVTHSQPGALIAIWGTSASDVWAVGGDKRDGTGPTVLHYDGTAWEPMETGEPQGNLWWVFGFENGPVFMGGDGGMILRYESGVFTTMQTPSRAAVYGIWGASPDDVWAVGNTTATSGAFAWRLAGDAWVDEPALPAEIVSTSAMWKVHGCAADDVYLVGTDGIALHWDGTDMTQTDTGSSTSLFNVFCDQSRTVAVGGLASSVIVEFDGTRWSNATPENAPGLTGLYMGPDDTGIATGQFGAVLERVNGAWQNADLGFSIDDTLHGSWIDPDGGQWAVGGQVLTLPLTDGLIIHKGAAVTSDGL